MSLGRAGNRAPLRLQRSKVGCPIMSLNAPAMDGPLLNFAQLGLHSFFECFWIPILDLK